ncbi:DEAD/H helicase [Crucibulum laeve]|uniref:DEAD/H helicase n=1 Tax=Crucibulum laeve TaxID=68775 RepID=A0A5C3MBG3_9AGAR|nr:DEAD/H helicase [Crucibulum laeve]
MKRAFDDPKASGSGPSKPTKKLRQSQSKSNNKASIASSETPWPDHFTSLFKVFKAINTVLAFVSSRKQIATTFPVIRASVEGLLKHPLEISRVAELKALLPDLIKFTYIDKNELLINEKILNRSTRRDNSPEFSLPASSYDDADGHVLILEFVDHLKGKKTRNSGFQYTAPPTLTPAAMKKLVEKRNQQFEQAVNELLLATPETENAIDLIQEASREHIPVSPNCPPKKEDKTFPSPDNRLPMDDIIEEVKEQEWYIDQIVHRRTFDAKNGQIAQLDPSLSEAISEALKSSREITTFYTHQVAAIQAIHREKHVIVSTSTASGKSIIYQVPILQFLERDSSAKAMLVYPTKALAQDQKAALEQLIGACAGLSHIKVATYDGDTPQELRADIRSNCSVIFTNFDMIHASILPNEHVWRTFLKNLKLLAVDELHCYSGLFGSHVSYITRRLRRACTAIGNRRLRFISCTATISNPRQHMQTIFGLEPSEIEVVSEDGAPSGRKDFLVWNPPLVLPEDPRSSRVSSLSEATQLMRFLMKRGVRVILFCKIRKICELAMKTIITELGNEGRHDILERVKPYRGGYSREDRRRIEHEAFSGNLLGIIATNALELGVDIGILDAVIMLGFPMSIASFRQQAGRAGRRAQDSLAVLVADPFPIDTYYVDNPTELFEQVPHHLIVDLDNKMTLESHLQCAAHEMPISLEDKAYFGPLMAEICESRLKRYADGWYHTHPKFLPFPSRFISIRGAQEETYTVIKMSKSGQGEFIIEEIEISRAMFEIYEGGVFMHQGLTYVVKEVNHDRNFAKVFQAEVNYITSPRDFTDVDAKQTLRIRDFTASRAFYGKIDLYVKVFGFFKIRSWPTYSLSSILLTFLICFCRNKAIIDSVDLDTPPWECETTGFWIDVPKALLALMYTKGINPAEAIHSAQHALLNQFALSEDVKTECKAPEKEYRVTESSRKRPARLIFYDAIGKGGGVSAKAFDIVHELLQKASAAIDRCECERGCTNCTQSTMCREANEVGSKLGASIVLKGLLGHELDPDAIPLQEQTVSLPQTIVEASAVRRANDVRIENVTQNAST